MLQGFRERGIFMERKKTYRKNDAREPNCRGRAKDRGKMWPVGFLSRGQTPRSSTAGGFQHLVGFSLLAQPFLFQCLPFRTLKGSGMHSLACENGRMFGGKYWTIKREMGGTEEGSQRGGPAKGRWRNGGGQLEGRTTGTKHTALQVGKCHEIYNLFLNYFHCMYVGGWVGMCM